jgi:hypothetical protein
MELCALRHRQHSHLVNILLQAPLRDSCQKKLFSCSKDDLLKLAQEKKMCPWAAGLEFNFRNSYSLCHWLFVCLFVLSLSLADSFQICTSQVELWSADG